MPNIDTEPLETPSELDELGKRKVREVLYQVWRDGRDGIDRYDSIENAEPYFQRLIAEAQEHLLDDVLEEGRKLTETTKKGNSVEWYPGGLWAYLHQRRNEVIATLTNTEDK